LDADEKFYTKKKSVTGERSGCGASEAAAGTGPRKFFPAFRMKAQKHRKKRSTHEQLC